MTSRSATASACVRRSASLDSVIHGNGNQAQFNHPEFSGAGQWMRGGMTMLSDMIDNFLNGRVDGLCNDLSNPDLVGSSTFQSQSQWATTLGRRACDGAKSACLRSLQAP